MSRLFAEIGSGCSKCWCCGWTLLAVLVDGSTGGGQGHRTAEALVAAVLGRITEWLGSGACLADLLATGLLS
jgi:hypothetical protein